MSVPVFAVVGHPNKGKSSIVSTLSHDDYVAISPLPGTTIHCRRYPMTVDHTVLYILVDTPGFQRARKVLAWLLERVSTAAEHPEAVMAFLESHGGDPQFHNEIELLKPIMEGAGILYVVDGSVPFGSEYEAEMEILRWTGQPRMALINPIGEPDHVEEWSAALSQYFGVVRVFDAVMADFHKQVELLRAFGQLKEEWRQPLETAVKSLTADRKQRRTRAARIVAETISEMLTLRVKEELAADGPSEHVKSSLLSRYRENLQDLERKCRDRVEVIYDHHHVHRIEDELELLGSEQLFSKETWSIFGLSKSQIVGFGAVGGSIAGGFVDAALGGASFLLGAVIGAGIGATAAALTSDKLVEVEVLNISLGKRLMVAGPTKNINFPHIVLERARLHHALVSGRTHAQRGELDTLQVVREVTPPLPIREKKNLEQAFNRIRRGRDTVAATEKLAGVVEQIFDIQESFDTPISLDKSSCL
jgi:GTPase Era involved in 16S rRNA processing